MTLPSLRTPGIGYDPDDSSLLSCDQIPPNGGGTNVTFYCNHALDGSLHSRNWRQPIRGLAPADLRSDTSDLPDSDFPFITLYRRDQTSRCVRKGTHNYQISDI